MSNPHPHDQSDCPPHPKPMDGGRFCVEHGWNASCGCQTVLTPLIPASIAPIQEPRP